MPTRGGGVLASGSRRGDVVMTKSYEDELEFEALFSESEQDSWIDLQPGDEVRARVVHVGSGGIQLDINGWDGLLDGSSYSPEERPVVGDTVRCYVLRVRNRLVEVGTKMSRTGQSKAALETAAVSGMPIEGKITETNKGGYVVEVGGASGFCPHGQIDVMRIEEPETLVGRTLMFKVTELREGRDPVLSRRAVLMAEREAQAEETRATLVVGARFQGRVTSIRDFGFFVDIGGLEGLVHVSELPYGKKRPQEVVSSGDMLEVEVVRIEEGIGDKPMRIGLSMRALAADPFEAAVTELLPGTILRGTVTRIQPYGAFVEVAGGVEGLLHVSAFGRRIPSVRDVVSDGDRIIVRIKEIDEGLRRMSLAWVEPEDLDRTLDPDRKPEGNSLGAEVLGFAADKSANEGPGEASPTARPEKKPPPKVGTLLDVTVDKHMRFGLIARWPEHLGGPGEGMIPTQELEVAYGADLRRTFPVGTRMEAVVTDIRSDGRVRLSVKQAAQAKERAEAAEYMQSQAKPKASAEEIGSFGALLKEKLGL